MYILFNSNNGTCFNISSGYGAFDCWLGGVMIAGAKLEKEIYSYRKELISKKRISCGNVHLFDAKYYAYADGKICAI